MPNLNEWRDDIHALAVEKGWWDKDVSFGDFLSNVHAELSEAWEEYRNGRNDVWFMCSGKRPCVRNECANYTDGACRGHAMGKKPEGVHVELADAVIRILDWCGAKGVDIEEIVRIKHKFNKTRPYRHGGKKV